VSVRRSASGGEFDLSNPVNSFVDVVRRVVLQPVRFFAGVERADERTRTAFLHITSDHSGVAGVCTELQIPHI
jgi:hypothetical protein